MAQTLNFSVDDTSPTISYSPFTDIFPPNLTAGWNSFFNGSGFPAFIGGISNETSLHATSHDQATLSVTWRGTGIQVLGSVRGNASYEATLDGKIDILQTSNPSLETLVAFQHLTDEVHNLLITAVIPPGGDQSAFFFDSAMIYFNTSSSSSPNPQPLNQSDILFSSNWGSQTIDNIQFHQSHTKGDVVQLTFSEGAAFLLRGMTSSAAGKYSVVLDNSTSTLNGKSTFSNINTLLFYATGLDPTIQHHVQIRNDDGSDLLLGHDGFIIFTTGLSNVNAQPPLPSAAAIAKGTIAAVVLAGILGFLIISGFLYFYFVIRPQRRRDRVARIERRRKKEKEAGPLGVLNIAPTVFPDDVEIGSQEGTLGHHKKQSSEKSGFTRWKREVEGGFGGLGLLGITFRHSGSTGRKSGSTKKSGSTGRKSRRSGGRLSVKSSIFTLSSLFTLSSSKGSHRGRKKAKSNQVSESSLSASLVLELPVRPHSPDSIEKKDAEVSRFSPDVYLSESDMHTLSYMNTPSVRPVQTPAHSPSGSNSKSRLKRQFVPRPSPHGHSSHGSVGRLLSYNDPKLDPHEDIGNSHGPSAATISPPSDPGHLSTLAPRDRGSARYSSDDPTSYYLGSAATRLAIRNLSPRTTQSHMQSSPEQTERKARASDKTPELHTPTPAQPVSSPPISDTSFLYVVTPATRSIDIPPAEISPVRISPAGITELPRDVGLDIPPFSPFRIDFLDNSPHSSGHLEPPVNTDPLQVADPGQNINTIRSVFRLTPPSNPPSSGHARNSFLDLEPSPDMSSQLQSTIPSEKSAQKQKVEKSRWSNSTAQTTNLSRSGSFNVSNPVTSPTSGPTSYFPYPVSLTPSSYHLEGHMSSGPSQSRSTVLHIEHGPPDRRLARLRLSAFGSPTDSVPMSVTSERRLRHSGSTGVSGGGANSSQLLPHPPLPHKRSSPSFPPL